MPETISRLAGTDARATIRQIIPISKTAIHHGNVPNMEDEYPQPVTAPAMKPSSNTTGRLFGSVKATAHKDMPNPQVTEPRIASIVATLFDQKALIAGSRMTNRSIGTPLA